MAVPKARRLPAPGEEGGNGQPLIRTAALGRVEQLAEQITAGVLPHMGRTWRWRVALVAAVVAGLLAGAVVGLLQSPREEPVTSGSRHPVRRPASVG